MHICVDKSLEFSYHMFNCNCCKIWWMFFLWTLFVQLNIVANLLFACRFKMGYFCLFVQLNIVANLLFACRFKMGYFCFNLAIAPHTVQLNECVRSTSESIHQSYWNRRWYTADRKRFAALLRVRRVSGTVCDIALSHTRTGSKPCPMQNTIPVVFFQETCGIPNEKHTSLLRQPSVIPNKSQTVSNTCMCAKGLLNRLW